MDIRTLTFVNLIFLFLYAALITVNSTIHGQIRGGNWFVLSNITRGLAGVLLALSAFLPRSLSTIAGDLLLVVGLTLLHRSFAELLGRGQTGWKLHLGLTLVIFLGVSYSTLVYGSYTAALVLVSFALAVQMALTTALLFSGLSRGTRGAIWFTGSILLLYAFVEMTRAIFLLRTPAGLLQVSSSLVAALLIGALLANGGTAFGFLFLSSAQLRRELTMQAEHDALTGVLNRRGLQSLAERRLTSSHRAAEPVSVVSLDLDGMKTANDTWGHECGDAMLRAVAGLLVSTVGPRGAVARLGGDEFVVVLPGIAEGGAYEMAETLRSAIEHLRVANCRPRASFGVASMNGFAWQDAIRKSDQALLRAKTAGRNRVICYA
jgi:diguanylate cyclase (GGDEF)-like protein